MSELPETCSSQEIRRCRNIPSRILIVSIPNFQTLKGSICQCRADEIHQSMVSIIATTNRHSWIFQNAENPTFETRSLLILPANQHQIDKFRHFHRRSSSWTPSHRNPLKVQKRAHGLPSLSHLEGKTGRMLWSEYSPFAQKAHP